MARPTALPPRISTAAPVRTYYVDPSTGNDSRTAVQAQSSSTPWATLTKALNTIQVPSIGANEPQTIQLRGTDEATQTRGITITARGPSSVTNYESKNFLIGTVIGPGGGGTCFFPADSPLTIENAPGERVLLHATLTFSWNCTNIRVKGNNVNGKKGIVIDGSYGAGSVAEWLPVSIQGAAHIEIYNCEIRNGSEQGVYVGNASSAGSHISDDIQIINNFIHHNGGPNVAPNTNTSLTQVTTTAGYHDHGIYYGGTTSGINPGTTGGAIYNNVVAWNDSAQITLHNASVECVVAHNLCLGWGGLGYPLISGATNPYTGAGPTKTAVGAEPSSAYSSGIALTTNTGETGDTNCVFANNILYGCWHSGIHVLLDTPSAQLGTGNIEKNNCFYANGDSAINKNYTLDAGTFTEESTLLNNDPAFTAFSVSDPTACNFQPTGVSPCLNAGASAFTPTFDYGGAVRSTSDIGPYAITSTSTGAAPPGETPIGAMSIGAFPIGGIPSQTPAPAGVAARLRTLLGLGL